MKEDEAENEEVERTMEGKSSQSSSPETWSHRPPGGVTSVSETFKSANEASDPPASMQLMRSPAWQRTTAENTIWASLWANRISYRQSKDERQGARVWSPHDLKQRIRPFSIASFCRTWTSLLEDCPSKTTWDGQDGTLFDLWSSLSAIWQSPCSQNLQSIWFCWQVYVKHHQKHKNSSNMFRNLLLSHDDEVFRSMQVATSSKTPYSDATQVSVRTLSFLICWSTNSVLSKKWTLLAA